MYEFILKKWCSLLVDVAPSSMIRQLASMCIVSNCSLAESMRLVGYCISPNDLINRRKCMGWYQLSGIFHAKVSKGVQLLLAGSRSIKYDRY